MIYKSNNISIILFNFKKKGDQNSEKITKIFQKLIEIGNSSENIEKFQQIWSQFSEINFFRKNLLNNLKPKFEENPALLEDVGVIYDFAYHNIFFESLAGFIADLPLISLMKMLKKE